MKNIYDYVEKYRNEKIVEINSLDALVFARIAYIHFEEFSDALPIKIKYLRNFIFDIKTNTHDKKLVEMISRSERYQDIIISRMEHVSDKEKEEDFLAITLVLPNKSSFISFRGTTKSIIGYKEDLNMSYKIIPSQIDALKYFNSEKKYDKYYLGGHSKGGNLAMYAGMNSKTAKRNKIERIYNFDGPGFLEIDDKFLKIKSKIMNYFPECSIVGRMMYNDSTINPIKTSKTGIEGHNVYYWNVLDNDFIYGKILEHSNDFHEKCLLVIDKIQKEKREIIINYIFELVLKGEIKSLKDLSFEEIKKIINNAPKIELKDKEYLMELMKSFMKCLIPSIK